MSRNEIENILHKVRLAAIVSENPVFAEKAVDALDWYVLTGRASIDFIMALGRCRVSVLVSKITPVWSCTDEVLRVTKQHLHFQ